MPVARQPAVTGKRTEGLTRDDVVRWYPDGIRGFEGSSDSVASIAGAILGARAPQTVNESWYAVVEQISGQRLMALGNELAALRR